MKLKEAINHLEETIKTMECSECKNEHIQLKNWLCELEKRRNNDKEGEQ